MRTVDPTSIRIDFVTALTGITTTFDDAEDSDIPASGKKLFVGHSFLAAATLLEGFASDLFIAYINRDNSRFVTHLLAQMVIETKDSHAKQAMPLAKISIQKHLTTSQIRSILDSKDYNITFATVAEMKASAGKWLIPAFRDRFTAITAQQSALIEATKSIRNFLAHRSRSSKQLMQAVLIHADLHANLRRGQHKIADVGSFLQARPTPGQPKRLRLYLDALEQLALTLCP